MSLVFTKMQGLGNDFVVIDATEQPLNLTPEQCRFLADRRFGIGCDQILLVESPRDPDTAFYYRIYNADGSEAGQCGNGARCFARFVHEKGLTERTEIPVGTRSGTIRLHLEEDGRVRVNMGPPRLTPAEIPFDAETTEPVYELAVEGKDYSIGAVSMGNPHAVLRVEDVATAPVRQLGPLIEAHPRFPERVNVGFMQVQSRERIRLRVWERGVGETLACGTGACAAAVSGQIQGLLDDQVSVALPGGELLVQWGGAGEPVWMSGPAVSIFEGRIEL